MTDKPFSTTPAGDIPENAARGMLRALCDCCAQLLALEPAAELRDALAEFIERARKDDAAHAAMLREYVDLQRQVLQQLPAEARENAAMDDATRSLQGLPIYSTVADAIEGALLRLLAQEAVAAVAPEPLLGLQRDIERGINWYELAAHLASLADWFALSRGDAVDRSTGLPTGDALQKQVQLELERLQRFGHAFCVVNIEIANLDELVDLYGQAAAAKALHLVARIVRGSLRNVDFLGRGEGSTLLALLPETGEQDAAKLVEDVGELVQRSPFHFSGQRVEVRLLYGVCAALPSDTAGQICEKARQNRRQAGLPGA